MSYKDKDKQKVCQHDSYLRLKDQYRENNRKRRKERREWFDDITKNDVCYFCGETNKICLGYHHKDRKTKLSTISKLLSDLRSKEMILAELKKCICVCANCHLKVEAGILKV